MALYPAVLSAARVKAHFAAGAGPYRAVVVADGPRAHWRLGATAGTTALDAMGNAYPGTYFAGTTLGVAGALGLDTDKAARMATTAGTIEVPDNAALDFGTTTEFSVEAWVKTTTNGEGAIVAKETSSTANPGWRITVTDGVATAVTLSDLVEKATTARTPPVRTLRQKADSTHST